MIKCMNREVEDINTERRAVPGNIKSPMGATVLLKGDKFHRWVPYDLISWESVDD